MNGNCQQSQKKIFWYNLKIANWVVLLHYLSCKVSQCVSGVHDSDIVSQCSPIRYQNKIHTALSENTIAVTFQYSTALLKNCIWRFFLFLVDTVCDLDFIKHFQIQYCIVEFYI